MLNHDIPGELFHLDHLEWVKAKDARIAALASRIAELEAALKPFATKVDLVASDYYEDETPVWVELPNGVDLMQYATVGDFRLAARVLKEIRP